MAAAPAGLPPGSAVGILGGGQLGRMIALAAAALGYRCHVYCPDGDAPAAEVAARATRADYDDGAALAAFARAVDVVTLEFENVPVEAVERIAATTPVRPDARALAVAQDRVGEKAFLNRIGVATTRFAEIASADDLRRAIAEIGLPAILKTARLGYDGKGQRTIRPGCDPGAVWRALGAGRAILEAHVDFAREVSIVLARGADGETSAFDTTENRHENGILRTSRVPARVPPELHGEVRSIAARIAGALDYVGVLAVEFFVTRAGGVLVNEIAPRVHNSGHWTVDACAASQFEQAVRAVCGLPLADPARHSDAVMTNILGAEIEGWRAMLAEPGACLHLYGKEGARPGRKMGHVTRCRRAPPSPLFSPGSRPAAPVVEHGGLVDARRQDFGKPHRPGAEFPDPQHVAKPAAEERAGRRVVPGTVLQPHQRGRAEHAGQQRALGVEAEIVGPVADRAPDAVDRPAMACEAERGVMRQAREGDAAADRVAIGFQHLQPRHDGRLDPLAETRARGPAGAGGVRHSRIRPVVERPEQRPRTAAQQARGLGPVDAELGGAGADRRPGPALRRGMADRGEDEPVPHFRAILRHRGAWLRSRAASAKWRISSEKHSMARSSIRMG